MILHRSKRKQNVQALGEDAGAEKRGGQVCSNSEASAHLHENQVSDEYYFSESMVRGHLHAQ